MSSYKNKCKLLITSHTIKRNNTRIKSECVKHKKTYVHYVKTNTSTKIKNIFLFYYDIPIQTIHGTEQG